MTISDQPSKDSKEIYLKKVHDEWTNHSLVKHGTTSRASGYMYLHRPILETFKLTKTPQKFYISLKKVE